jgi:hypothetical protein
MGTRHVLRLPFDEPSYTRRTESQGQCVCRAVTTIFYTHIYMDFTVQLTNAMLHLLEEYVPMTIYSTRSGQLRHTTYAN